VLAHGEGFVAPMLPGIAAVLAVEFGQRGSDGMAQRGNSRGGIAMAPAHGFLHHQGNPLYPFRSLEKKWAIKL